MWSYENRNVRTRLLGHQFSTFPNELVRIVKLAACHSLNVNAIVRGFRFATLADVLLYGEATGPTEEKPSKQPKW